MRVSALRRCGRCDSEISRVIDCNDYYAAFVRCVAVVAAETLCCASGHRSERRRRRPECASAPMRRPWLCTEYPHTDTLKHTDTPPLT